MVFKRRNRRSVWEWTREMVYPTGGFRRAIQYVRLRLTRLPDKPHRIARGIFAGVFVSFTPFFGVHFVIAALLAWLIRGNILAAMLATFVGNPLTTPFIAISSVQIGHRLLEIEAPLTFLSLVEAFTRAGGELWHNVMAIFTPDKANWTNLGRFWETIYLPYLIGGLLPGLVAGLLFYWGTIPIVHAYQKIRATKLGERIAKRHAERDARHAHRTESHGASRSDGPVAVGDDGRPPVG